VSRWQGARVIVSLAGLFYNFQATQDFRPELSTTPPGLVHLCAVTHRLRCGLGFFRRFAAGLRGLEEHAGNLPPVTEDSKLPSPGPIKSLLLN
jgi:hypothetical protein